jgi:uncharacterized membrane protein|tara:strand:+ start:1109 stop:2254 length:1146 start_codon:yes stop_codon:yes gene_type:complete
MTGAEVKKRIVAIDVMRGLVIVLMLVDHVRERFYFHLNVTDPMDLDITTVDLFFTRMTAHLCAPTFVFLTGLSAWLYAHPANKPPRSPSTFLFKRGLFIILIEVTLINFSWMGNFDTLWLQVMWVIGLSMIALAILVKLRFWMLGVIGFLIVFGHNALDPISFTPDEFGYTLWTILHDRGFLIADGPVKVKASYPLLPWIGVILLGYFSGPLYAKTMDYLTRRRLLIGLGLGCLAILLVLRVFNIYGENLPWVQGETAIQTVMSFINFTKYPPSLDYLLLTLGCMFLLLAWFESLDNKFTESLEILGSAPMFFYIVHLYVLLIGYRILLSTVGPNQGELFGVDHFWIIWVISILLTLALYFPTKVFAKFKHSTNMAWVKYF